MKCHKAKSKKQKAKSKKIETPFLPTEALYITIIMYEKYTYEDICNNHEFKNILLIKINIHDTELLCTTSGKVFRKMRSGFWKEVENKRNHSKGYNVILVEKKQYMRSKLILYALHKINLEDKNTNIYHINGNRLDCASTNLTYQVPSDRFKGIV